jgi:hypothetical protein
VPPGSIQLSQQRPEVTPGTRITPRTALAQQKDISELASKITLWLEAARQRESERPGSLTGEQLQRRVILQGRRADLNTQLETGMITDSYATVASELMNLRKEVVGWQEISPSLEDVYKFGEGKNPTAFLTHDEYVKFYELFSTAIQESGYSARNRFYTRRPIPGSGAQMVPQKYRGFSSGPIATSIACEDLHGKIYLLGFDMGPTVVGKFNNVYAGTEFYKPADANPTFTGNWIQQLTTVIRDFPNVEFVRVCGDTTADIPNFKVLPNLQYLPIADFVLRINTSKDL